MFHWDIGAGTGGYDSSRSLDAAGHSLYFGNAWVMAAARKLFGGSPQADLAVLVAPGGPSDTLARGTEGSVGTDACGNTTASGVGGVLENNSGVGLLVNVFSHRKDCIDPAAVSVAFECAACEETRVQIVRK